MIYGIQAAQPDSGGGGGNPYPDSIGVADFITGDFWIGSTQLSAADVIDNPSYITASGLQIVDTQPNPTHILGALLDLLTTMNWTIVLEWQDVFPNDGTVPLWIANTTTVAEEQTFIESDNTQVDFYDQPVPGLDRQVTKSGLPAQPVTRRAAITRVASKFAVSINGGSVTSDTAGTGAITAYDSAAFGGAPDSSSITLDVNIRRLIIYPEQSDAALPGLSS